MAAWPPATPSAEIDKDKQAFPSRAGGQAAVRWTGDEGGALFPTSSATSPQQRRAGIDRPHGLTNLIPNLEVIVM